MAGGNHHGGEGEVFRRNGVAVGGHARAARADVTHLAAAIFGIKVGLELQGIEVVLARGKARNACAHPVFKAGALGAIPSTGAVVLCDLAHMSLLKPLVNTKSDLLFVLLIKPGSFGETIIRRLARYQQAHFLVAAVETGIGVAFCPRPHRHRPENGHKKRSAKRSCELALKDKMKNSQASRSSLRRILPTGVFGRSVRKTMWRGRL